MNFKKYKDTIKYNIWLKFTIELKQFKMHVAHNRRGMINIYQFLTHFCWVGVMPIWKHTPDMIYFICILQYLIVLIISSLWYITYSIVYYLALDLNVGICSVYLVILEMIFWLQCIFSWPVAEVATQCAVQVMCRIVKHYQWAVM